MKEFEELYQCGLVPYVATSRSFISHLDFSVFGGKEIVKVLEDETSHNFHEAYLLSNSLAFGGGDMKMPNWVYIDCVLMQSAVVGFMIRVQDAPAKLLQHYLDDPNIDVDNLDYIPVSGQIAALGIDGKSFTGFSLFSLRKYLSNRDLPSFAGATKYAALSVYKAQEYEKYVGISQYDNRALITHAAFSDKVYIDTAIAMFHTLRDMSFVYSMKIDLDAYAKEKKVYEPDFLLKADDKDKKQEMQERIGAGEKFFISHPVHIQKDDGLYLPICIER